MGKSIFIPIQYKFKIDFTIENCYITFIKDILIINFISKYVQCN